MTKTIKVLAGGRFTRDVGFANCHSARVQLFGDVQVIDAHWERAGSCTENYVQILDLGKVAAVFESWSRNPGGSHWELHLGTDSNASTALAVNHGLPLTTCEWCRGEVYASGASVCDECSSSQCECGAFPGGLHYDNCKKMTIVIDAIEKSIHRDTIAPIECATGDEDLADILAELKSESEGNCSYEDHDWPGEPNGSYVHEYWGTTDDGEEWRVHVYEASPVVCDIMEDL